jgi:hypothetical protein
MSNQFGLMRDRRFFPFFLTQFFGAFNDNLYKNALIILITFKAGKMTSLDPQLLVNMSAGIFILPFFYSPPRPDNWRTSSIKRV